MVDFESKDKPEFCEKCGQRIIKAKEKFRKFLLDNSLPVLEWKKYIDEFYDEYKNKFIKYGSKCYDARSDIAHRGKLFYRDLFKYGTLYDINKFEKVLKEDADLYKLMQLTRISHVGWLLKQKIEL